MFFTKDKKREAARRKAGSREKRPAPREERPESRRRPAPEGETRRKPAPEEARRKRPAPEGEPRRRPAPETEARPRRRPAREAELQHRRRPAPEEEARPRRRPAPQGEPGRSPVPEDGQRRRRPPEEPENSVTQTIHYEPGSALDQLLNQPLLRENQEAARQPEALRETPAAEEAPEVIQESAAEAPAERVPDAAHQEPPHRRRPAPEGEPRRRSVSEGQPQRRRKPEARASGDAVHSMENAPRRNAAAPGKDLKGRKMAGRKQRPAPEDIPARASVNSFSVKDAPQGTSYKRHGARARKSILDKYFHSNAGKDPELVADEARMKLMQRDEVEEKKKKHPALFDTPAIVYTQPKVFNRTRLLLQLITVLAVVCAFVLALSIFFKVRVITVSGAETYSAWSIREASGISEGDNLLTFGRARANGQIMANLPYVESVRIGIKLPDTVNIEVRELDVAYSIKSGDGDWWLMTSGGKVVQQITAGEAKDYTKVLGVELDKPAVGEQAFPVEAVPDAETTPDGTDPTAETKAPDIKSQEAPITVSGAQRLGAAMEILTALEDNDIVGEAASVNVANIEKIELWYGQRYQVNLGDNRNLEDKISCMYDVILQLSDYQTGMLDISFTKKEDQVIYTPFA